MGRVGRALLLHELLERTRDRWVLTSAFLFALLAAGIALYGRSAGEGAEMVTAPSLVTLSALLVPLVALVLGHDAIVGERERRTLGLLLSLPVRRGEVLVAKFLGRALALTISIGAGIGVAALLLGSGRQAILLSLVVPTLLLGMSFLSLGVLLSVLTSRHVTAASLAVATWFLLVLFYDLGLLAVLVATDGALSQEWVMGLVTANPAGLYRIGQTTALAGEGSLSELGLLVSPPGPEVRAVIWAAWIGGPLLVGALVLGRRRAVTS